MSVLHVCVPIRCTPPVLQDRHPTSPSGQTHHQFSVQDNHCRLQVSLVTNLSAISVQFCLLLFSLATLMLTPIATFTSVRCEPPDQVHGGDNKLDPHSQDVLFFHTFKFTIHPGLVSHFTHLLPYHLHPVPACPIPMCLFLFQDSQSQ